MLRELLPTLLLLLITSVSEKYFFTNLPRDRNGCEASVHEAAVCGRGRRFLLLLWLLLSVVLYSCVE